MGIGKRREPLFSVPLPIVPRALSFSFSPATPQHKEASAEEREPAPFSDIFVDVAVVVA